MSFDQEYFFNQVDERLQRNADAHLTERERTVLGAFITVLWLQDMIKEPQWQPPSEEQD